MPLSPVAEAIAHVEGWFNQGPPTVAQINNNPGNLIYAGQRGARPAPVVGPDGKTRIFAAWATPAEGEAALERDLQAKAKLGFSLERTIQAWLGNTKVANAEGDPVLYTSIVAARVGADPSTPLADLLPFGPAALPMAPATGSPGQPKPRPGGSLPPKAA